MTNRVCIFLNCLVRIMFKQRSCSLHNIRFFRCSECSGVCTRRFVFHVNHTVLWSNCSNAVAFAESPGEVWLNWCSVYVIYTFVWWGCDYFHQVFTFIMCTAMFCCFYPRTWYLWLCNQTIVTLRYVPLLNENMPALSVSDSIIAVLLVLRIGDLLVLDARQGRYVTLDYSRVWNFISLWLNENVLFRHGSWHFQFEWALGGF